MNLAHIFRRLDRYCERHFSGDGMTYRQIVAIIAPVLVDQAFIVGMGMINTALISSSGVAALSAVSMVDSVNLLLINIFIALATGGTVIVAQYKGAGGDRMVNKAAATSIAVDVLVSGGIGALMLAFHAPLLHILFGGAAHDVMQNAVVYFLGSSISYVGIAVEESVCSSLRGVGETRSALLLSLIMNLSYVLFNIVLVTILHMGVLGMTIAINLARYLGAACSLLFLRGTRSCIRFHFRDLFPLDMSMLRRIFVVGLPFAAEQGFFQGGKLLTQTFIVRLGTYALATNAICNSFSGVLQIPGNALSLAVVTVVGQCIGRRNIHDARKYARLFVWASAVSFIVTSLLLLPVFMPLVYFFHAPAPIIPDIVRLELVTSLFQIPVWSISFVLPSALRAAGDAKFTSITAMLTMWLVRVVLGYVLGIVMHYGIGGVWLAMNLEWCVRGAIFLIRYRGNRWYAHHLID